jgi:nondiscriminating glutamyl-tRNA synthetase
MTFREIETRKNEYTDCRKSMTTEQKVKTRFAPSPTGHLHIGNARTAVMNWIFARRHGGSFLLRIEDTDRERSTRESETSILRDLEWLGLTWDEGPDRGGPNGPYRQSERLDLYRDLLAALEKAGQAYPCYCSPEELEERRRERLARGESPGYDGHCRDLSEAERRALEAGGRRPAIRFRVESGETRFEDLIKGPISFSNGTIGDFVLVRGDGMPMYNFACVADDHLMDVTHVIRGNDHVSNTPRQVLLYLALGWTPPAFAHIPMILGGDRERLSKRHGATSVDQYRAAGYLPEALVNFLSLLSWSSESGDEILGADRLVREFGFDRVSESPAVFNVEKLDWMNGQYLRALDPARFCELALPFFREAGIAVQAPSEIRRVTDLLQGGVDRLAQAPEKARIFFAESAVPENAEAGEILRSPEAGRIGPAFLDETLPLVSWNAELFLAVMKEIQKRTGIKGKNLWMPIRVMLTGQVHGPELPKVAEVLGWEKCRRFVKESLERSGAA